MKKLLLIGCLILVTACLSPSGDQSADSTPAPDPAPTQTPLPAPIPDTPAPEIPVTPTVSPAPEPPPYYFTEEFDAASPYWEILQTGGMGEPVSSFESGSLRIDIPSPDTWSIGVSNAHTYTNVAIRAKVSASPSGSVGLLCRYDEAGGWFEYNAASDGTYNALYGQWLAPGVAKYIPLVSNSSVHIPAGALDYEIGLSCQDNFIMLFVNDIMIRRVDVTNYGLVEGKIGVTASSFREAPMTALFEWVRVGME